MIFLVKIFNKLINVLDKFFSDRIWLAWSLIVISTIYLVFGTPTLFYSLKIDATQIKHYRGHSYIISVPNPVFPTVFVLKSNSNTAAQASTLRVLEDGKHLGGPHAIHQSIFDVGGGVYSHWGSHRGSHLFFSTSDNSDPRVNGRIYRLIGFAELNSEFETLIAICLLTLMASGVIAVLRVNSDRSINSSSILSSKRTFFIRSNFIGLSLVFSGLFGLIASPYPPEELEALSVIETLIHRLASRPGLDVLVLVGSTLIGAVTCWRFYGKNSIRWGSLVGGAAGLVLVVNAALIGPGETWINWTPDSYGYTFLNSCRSPGVFLFFAPFLLLDPGVLIVTQLNLLLASLVALAIASAYSTRSTLVGWLTLLLGIHYGEQVAYSFDAMSEAISIASVGFALAAAIAFVKCQRLWLAICFGVSLGIAIAVKASNPVLLFAALPILLVVSGQRFKMGLALVGIPVAILLGLLTYGRMSHGSWSATNFMGTALVGHVGYAIRNDALSSDPKLSSDIEKRIKPYLDKLPSFRNLNDYILVSANDYNAILRQNIIPLVDSDFKSKGLSYYVCNKSFNSKLMTLSMEAIRREPLWFAKHVFAHYVGLWSYATIQRPLSHIGFERRLLSIRAQKAVQSSPFPAAWRASSEQLSKIAAAQEIASKRKYFLDRRIKLGNGFGLFIGFCATVLGALVFFLNRMPKEIVPLVVVSAFLAANYAAHAMFQVALVRYTASMQFGIGALAAMMIVIGARLLWRHMIAPRMTPLLERMGFSTPHGERPGPLPTKEMV